MRHHTARNRINDNANHPLQPQPRKHSRTGHHYHRDTSQQPTRSERVLLPVPPPLERADGIPSPNDRMWNPSMQRRRITNPRLNGKRREHNPRLRHRTPQHRHTHHPQAHTRHRRPSQHTHHPQAHTRHRRPSQHTHHPQAHTRHRRPGQHAHSP